MADDVRLRNRRAYHHKRGRHHLCNPDRCSEAPRRNAVVTELPTSGGEPVETTLVQATKRDLEAGGQLDTVLGQQAVVLARRLSSNEVGASASSLSKEFRAVMAEALGDVPTPGDPVDELRAKREQKLAEGR